MRRRSLWMLLASALAAAAFAALVSGIEFRGAAKHAQASARAALVAGASGQTTAPPPHVRLALDLAHGKDRAAYWQALAMFVRAGAPGPDRSLGERLDELREVERTLREEADGGPRRARSTVWSLLALTYLAEAGGVAPAERHTRTGHAITALRRAVLLDAGNDDAKANLELLLARERAQQQSTQVTTGSGSDPLSGHGYPPDLGPAHGAAGGAGSPIIAGGY